MPRLRTVLGIVTVGAAVLHGTLAVATTASLETPNASTQIADTLATTGVYAARVWYRPTTFSEPPERWLRAFQLPAEPLYLAAAFTYLPKQTWPFLHVPIVVLLIVALGALAGLLGGVRAAAWAGALALCDPFLLRHGIVWDDTTFGAAFEWSVATFFVAAAFRPTRGWMRAASACAAAVSSLARLQSTIVILTAGAWLAAGRRDRGVGRAASTAVLGIALALAAWGTRNAIVLGHFFVGTSHDGQTLWQSNYPGARDSVWGSGRTQTLAPIDVPDGFGELEVDRSFRARAVAYLMAQPRDAMETGAFKCVVSLFGLDLAQPLLSARNVLAGLSTAAFFVIGIRGWHVARRLPATPQLAAFRVIATTSVAVTLLMLWIGPVGLRYRLDISAVMIIFGALGLAGTRAAATGTRCD